MAIQAACRSNQLAFDATGGAYRVSGRITVPSGVTVRGAGIAATSISCSDGATSIFVTTQATGVIVERIKFVVSAVSTAAHTGAVEFNTSTKCSCRQCEMVGCNWAGVLIHDSTYCTVDRCYCHDFQGTVQDSADVCIYNRSHHNLVTNNRCCGGNWHGISIEDPYSNSLPSHNLVAGNTVGAHRAYGLMVYVPSPGDTFNELTGNTVQDIQGSVLGRNSGAGIYVVGKGAGGTTVSGNTVRNCCVQTTRSILAPAGIGINGISAVAAPVSIRENTVEDMRAHDAILVISSSGRVTLAANSATLPPGNPASPIRVEGSSHVNVTGNSLGRDPATSGRCIAVHANAVAVANITITGNTCRGGASPQIELSSTAGGSISDVVCTGNTCRGPGVTPNCIRLVGVHGAAVSENVCLATL